MAGISTFSTRAAFVTPDGRLSREASQLIESLIAAAGGALGENGDEVFASTSSGTDVSSVSALYADVMLTQPAEQPHMAPMDMQPASQAPHDAPIVQQPAEQPFMPEMVMQPISESTGAPFVVVDVDPSPLLYVAPEPGTFSLYAGTITALTITRQGEEISIGTATDLIPVHTGDIVTVTYSSAPTLYFLPR